MNSILVGDPQSFALETAVSRWLPSTRRLGLGYFVLHVGSLQYGVRGPDATGLGGSYEGIMERLMRRGQHFAPFDPLTDASLIADAYLASGYWEERERDTFFGLGSEAFVTSMHASGIKWASDTEEAFGDGSSVLQLDVGEMVRIVAFQSTDWQPVLGRNVSDVWLEANEYYSLLEEWISQFDHAYLQSEAG